jgi:hypothetical protein
MSTKALIDTRLKILGESIGAQLNSGAASAPEGYFSFNSFSAIAYHE